MNKSLGLIFVLTTVVAATTPLCERAPAHAQPSDTAYRLTVAGEPDLFLPGELYTVTLQGVDVGHGLTPFVGFTIWAEIDEEPPAESDTSTAEIPVGQALGGFQGYDAQTKAFDGCQPAVSNATAHPKTEIQVIWSAPPNSSETCIRLCARASPVVGSGSPSVLARKICPAPSAPASFVRQPPIVEPCCACGEAKYEVLFEGLWSRNTHPREFPPENVQAHFGDIIGATHTAQYRVWQEGRVASSGLRRLADDGATTALEKELKAESDHIRTIIKSRGISWQQAAGIPNTFAVFRVDPKHHLISLASKLAPSPDWFLGVSALELCNANCTWSNAATLPLYPYDAGTDNGITFTARRQPTVPAAPVRALRPDWPKDARSPFFTTTNEMRPYARLRLTRLRLYEKSCDAAENEHVQESSGSIGACATYSWGPWSPCSVTCGEGRASRQRHYVWPARAYAEACRVQLTDYRKCRGPRMHCRAVSEYEPDPADSTGPCAVSAWSPWSPCEGCGVRARTRHYVVPRAYKRCHIGFRASTVLSQAMPCEAGPCDKPPAVNTSSAIMDWFYRDETRGECRVSQWSDWSPCSARCGRGRRIRTRFYLVRDFPVQREILRRLFNTWQGRFSQMQNMTMIPNNATSDDPEVLRLAQEHIDRCQYTLSQQEALCDGTDGNCGRVPPEVCQLPLMVGPCRSYNERWFFDAARNTCEPFGYTGCGGNANNFRDREDCIAACKNNLTTTTTTTTTTTPSPTQATETTTKKLKPVKPTDNNEVIQNDVPTLPEDANCETGPWLGWSDCVGDCDVAFKLSYRLVLRPASGAGRACRKLMRSRACRPATCRPPTGSTHLSSTDQPNYDDLDD